MTSPVNSNLPFKGKTVLITGSGTGIGQAIATKFAENGASIIIMGRRQKPLDETKEILLKTMLSVGFKLKFEPAMLTWVPASPLVGKKEVIIGTCATAMVALKRSTTKESILLFFIAKRLL